MLNWTPNIRALGLALVAALGSAAPASAADFTMKIGLATLNDIQHQWANWFKEAIEARAGQRLEVKIFPRGQLGTVASHIEGLQFGTIEAFVAPTDFFSGVDPRFSVFSIPLLFKDAVHAEKVLLEPDIQRDILSLGADKGLQVASVFTFAPAHYFGKQPIRSLDDFKGKKLRVNATAAERAKMRQFGATAVPMDLSELVPALQQGVVDGTMSATAVYVNFKFNEIGKTLTEVNDTMIVAVGVLSKAWLDRLPADLRAIVLEEGHKLSARLMAESRAMDEAMVKRWREVGGELVPLPDQDRAKLPQLLGGIGEEVTKSNPAVNSFYKKLKAAAEKTS